jgi:hypothetical protein
MTRFAKLSFLIMIIASSMVACNKPNVAERQIYTLYSNSSSDPSFRIHIASFDSVGEPEMHELLNKLNCERAADMFQSRPESKELKFWCENGRFRK